MFDYLTLRGWTSLDDVMFYIRGACRAIEFCVTLGMCGYIMMTFYAEMTSIAGRLFFTFDGSLNRFESGVVGFISRLSKMGSVAKGLQFATSTTIILQQCYMVAISSES